MTERPASARSFDGLGRAELLALVERALAGDVLTGSAAEYQWARWRAEAKLAEAANTHWRQLNQRSIEAARAATLAGRVHGFDRSRDAYREAADAHAMAAQAAKHAWNVYVRADARASRELRRYRTIERIAG